MTKILTLSATCLLLSGATFAQSGDAILDLLIKKGVINQREANEVREQLDQQNAATVEMYNKTKTASWLDSLTFSGDFRLRAEYFDFEEGLNAPDRLRFRYRLRVGAEMKFNEWATVGLRLASGEQGGNGGLTTNPNSANQTLTDDFSRKPIGIDLAYVALQPPHMDNVKIIGGKMLSPIWEPKLNSAVVWDPDINPEGVGEQVDFKLGGKQQYRLFLNAGQFVLNEFDKDENDTYLFDTEIGLEVKPNAHFKLTLAGGYFLTHNLDLVAVPTSSKNVGNATRTVGATTFYLDDFQDIYGRGELVWTVSDRAFLGTANMFTLAGEYLKNFNNGYESLTGANTAVDPDQTVGWTVQLAFGDNKKAGQWRVAYQYKWLEADSILDIISDDDYGSGGTDRRGHVIEASYNVRDWWQLRTCAFLTEKISARANGGHNASGIDGEEFFRIQMDSMFKF